MEPESSPPVLEFTFGSFWLPGIAADILGNGPRFHGASPAIGRSRSAEAEPTLEDPLRELVLAAVLGEVEESLGGKSPSWPEAAPAETRKPVRA